MQSEVTWAALLQLSWAVEWAADGLHSGDEDGLLLGGVP